MSKHDRSRSLKKCQICNKKAVGFHYGAYVCEACKKFFVRHSSGVSRLYGSCQDKGNCNLNIEGRGKCQHCRYKRCIDIGMNIDSKSSDYDLTSIPCQVCSAKSSGLHFGCITCEGCKGFFRRMIKLKGTLICFNDNKCKLDLKNRSTCKSCRMNRCLEVGMSRKGIRIGRHTNSMKYNCLNMLKTEKTSEITEDSTSDDNDQTVSSKSDTNENPNLSEGDTVTIKMEDTKTTEDTFVNEIKEAIAATLSEELGEINLNNVAYSERIQSITYDPFARSDDSPIIDSQINEEKEDLSESNLSKLDNSLNRACLFLTQQKVIIFREFFSNRTTKDSISNHDSIATVWSTMMDHFICHSQFIVKFAKLMPGFLELSLPDKRCIIKDSMYPMILMELSQDYEAKDLELCYNYFDFTASDRHLILKYFPEFNQFSVHVQEAGALRYSLSLDNFEITLLCGIMMFYNYHNLDNWMYGKSMVLLYQDYLTLYLRSQFDLSDHDISFRQKKCLDFIVVLNEMNLQHHQVIIDFCSNHHELQYPDLYIEIFNA